MYSLYAESLIATVSARIDKCEKETDTLLEEINKLYRILDSQQCSRPRFASIEAVESEFAQLEKRRTQCLGLLAGYQEEKVLYLKSPALMRTLEWQHESDAAVSSVADRTSTVLVDGQAVGCVARISTAGLCVSALHIVSHSGCYLNATAFGGQPLVFKAAAPYYDLVYLQGNVVRLFCSSDYVMMYTVRNVRVLIDHVNLLNLSLPIRFVLLLFCMSGPPGTAFSFPMNKFATVGFDIMTITLPSTLTVQADVPRPMVTTGFIADMSFCGDIATADYGQGMVHPLQTSLKLS
jgi:hypothetical protein